MTGYLVYQEFKSGCYRPPKYFEGEFNQFAYPGAMVYIYPTTDCTGYHTVASKSNIGNGGWVNVYHPVRSFKILDVNI
ncbi:hypothetical protein H4R19_001576 [Coemansia spiralis]|nr:hypothetical protein H4R19_001576 [Coemansia spiralis]